MEVKDSCQLEKEKETPCSERQSPNQSIDGNKKLKYVLRGPTNRDEKDSQGCPVITKRTMQRALAMEEDDPSVVHKMLTNNDAVDVFTGLIIDRHSMTSSVDESDITFDLADTDLDDLKISEGDEKVPDYLPPGWKRHFSRTKSREYYAHPQFGATWDFPKSVEQFSLDIQKDLKRSKVSLLNGKQRLENCTREERDPENGKVLIEKRLSKSNDDGIIMSNETVESKLEYPNSTNMFLRKSHNKHGNCCSDINKKTVVSDRVLNPPDPLCSLQHLFDVRLNS